MRAQRLVEIGDLEDVEDGRERLLPGDGKVVVPARRDERRLDEVARAVLEDAPAVADFAALLACGGDRGAKLLDRATGDERTHQDAFLARVADPDAAERGGEALEEFTRDAALHEEPPRAGAALSRGADGTKGNRSYRQIEIGSFEHDDAVVSAQLEDAPPQPRGDAGRDAAADGDRSGEGDERQPRIVRHPASRLRASRHDGEDALRAVLLRHPVAERLHRDAAERGERRRLPHADVSADRGERCVPGPDRHREVEGRHDADGAERVPLLQEPVAGPLGGDGEAVQLPGEPHGEIADVDHLLHFAEPLGADLPGLEGHQLAERFLVLAEELPEPAHELSALRGGPRAPFDESVQRRIDAVVVLGARGGADSPQRRARAGVDRLQHLAAAVACGSCSEVLEERGGV